MALYAIYNNVGKYSGIVKASDSTLAWKLPLLVGKTKISIPNFFTNISDGTGDKVLNGFTPNNCLIVAQGDSYIGSMVNKASYKGISHVSGYSYWHYPNPSSTGLFKTLNSKNVTYGVNNSGPACVYIKTSTIPTTYINVVGYYALTATYSSSDIPVPRDYFELSNTIYINGNGVERPVQIRNGATNSSTFKVVQTYATFKKDTSVSYFKAAFTPVETKSTVSNLIYHGMGFIFEFSSTARWHVEN